MTMPHSKSLIYWILICSIFRLAHAQTPPGAVPGPPGPPPQGTPRSAATLELPGSNAPLLTLNEAVRLATGGNPQFQSAKLEALQSFEQYKAQRTQYFPTITTFGIYSELLNKININIPAGSLGTFPATGQIPASATSFSTARRPFSLAAAYASQPLTSLIRLHYSINAQRWAAESKNFQAEQKREQQITSVKTAYSKVQTSEAQARASFASAVAVRETARITHARRDQAEALLSQVQTADAQLAAAESQLQQDIDQIADNKEKLNQSVGRDPMVEFTTEAIDESLAPEVVSDADLREKALHNRPELKQDDASIRSNQLQVKATRAMYLPDISASVVYVDLPNSVNGLPSSFATAGLQLTWTPWDWGQKRHQANAQQAAVKESQVQRDQDRNQILADVNQAARLYRQRLSQAHSSQLSATAARTSLLETQEQVRNGTALLQALLQAQTNDISAQAQIVNAKANLNDAKAQLQQAVGDVK